MSKPPSRPRPPSKPTDWSMLDRTSDFVGGDPGAGGSDDSAAQLVQMFAAELRGESELDQENKDELLRTFEDAVNAAKTSPGATAVPARADWVEVVDALRNMGAVDVDGSNVLVRKLDEALQPLHKPSVKLAMEFSQRCEADGEEKALEWFRAQKEGASEDEAAVPVPAGGQALRGDITELRSRRLRGPPRV